uniref:ATP synthase inhibitory factor subunit 1 n=1 Tax=Myotis myotis TaxID=51298 RepID=A0A7J7ZSZ4_MYOMY|nr:ATP synthase inhibitory factor subunit 1 [Myotis myotis]
MVIRGRESRCTGQPALLDPPGLWVRLACYPVIAVEKRPIQGRCNQGSHGDLHNKEKAEEEGYFPEWIKEQLAALKKQHEEEITHHKKEIERLQKEIEQHKQNIKKLKDHDTAAVSG